MGKPAPMESLDRMLFAFFNQSLSNPVFDWLMPFITDLHKQAFVVNFVFIPLLVLWIYFQRKKAVALLLGATLCIGMVDSFTYRVLKPAFKRERPPATESEIQLRTERFAGYSFPSNHAANNFAGAAFLSSCYPALSPIFFTVATLVGFSRIYVGVHYPFDVVAGGLLGAFFGLFFFRFWAIILIGIGRYWPSLAINLRGKRGIKDEKQTTAD